jgi:hypothetical protein
MWSIALRPFPAFFHAPEASNAYWRQQAIEFGGTASDRMQGLLRRRLVFNFTGSRSCSDADLAVSHGELTEIPSALLPFSISKWNHAIQARSESIVLHSA